MLVTSGISGQEQRQGLCPGDRMIIANGLFAFGTIYSADVLFVFDVPIIDSDLNTGRKRK